MPSAPYTYSYDHMKFTEFVPKLKKELLKAIMVFGSRVAGKGEYGLQRHLQRDQNYAGNNPWWAKAKNRKRVFYDTGFWRSKPSYKIIPSAGDTLIAIEVGFISATPHPSERKSGNFNIQELGKFLSQGASWTATPNKRKAFWKTVKSRGAKIDESKIIRKDTYEVKSRDFVKRHLMSTKVKALFMKQIDLAVKRTYKTTPRKKVSS